MPVIIDGTNGVSTPNTFAFKNRIIDGGFTINQRGNPANTDYANFKKQILADEAQLQDADGNVMADAKEYVASLP
jgi:hypothetical protein